MPVCEAVGCGNTTVRGKYIFSVIKGRNHTWFLQMVTLIVNLMRSSQSFRHNVTKCCALWNI